MTIPSSGTITSAMIAAEVGGYPFTIPSAEIRALTGVASGAITWPNDFYGKTGSGGGGGGSAALSDASAFDDTAAGVANIINVQFSTAVAGRRIFCPIWWSCTTSAVETTISSATIGGIAAAIHIQTGEGGTSALTNYGCAIISATVPTGTAGTVSLTFSNSTVRRAYCSAYRVTGLVSATPNDTAAAFAETSGAGTANASGFCNIGAGGLLFIAGIQSSDGSLPGLAFTGATERGDAAGSFLDRFGHAMSSGLGTQSSRAVGVSGSSDVTTRMRMVAASFQLA